MFLINGVKVILREVFLQPLPLLLLICGLAMANLWRKRVGRRSLLLLIIPFAVLVMTTMQAVVHPVVGSLEWPYPPIAARPPDVAAIVVLSGGIHPPDAIRIRAQLSDATINRCLHAAELYHQGGACPVIVSGGRFDPEATYPPDSALMRDLLIRLGVGESDLIEEHDSRNTRENAFETREILRRRGPGQVLLVTSALHMRRSLMCFRKLGIDAVAAPSDHRATELRWVPGNFIPSSGAVGNLTAALHEWIGIAWYRARGWI